jgi:hypothetical protein
MRWRWRSAPSADLSAVRCPLRPQRGKGRAQRVLLRGCRILADVVWRGVWGLVRGPFRHGVRTLRAGRRCPRPANKRRSAVGVQCVESPLPAVVSVAQVSSGTTVPIPNCRKCSSKAKAVVMPKRSNQWPGLKTGHGRGSWWPFAAGRCYSDRHARVLYKIVETEVQP